mmetsp:Transcript_22114/g.49902  ORF Transcript_22114/g.49902 Transcript_22114/m.49902 type:complete len:265 (-) Transcript_22114:1476-2270(-)
MRRSRCASWNSWRWCWSRCSSSSSSSADRPCKLPHSTASTRSLSCWWTPSKQAARNLVSLVRIIAAARDESVGSLLSLLSLSFMASSMSWRNFEFNWITLSSLRRRLPSSSFLSSSISFARRAESLLDVLWSFQGRLWKARASQAGEEAEKISSAIFSRVASSWTRLIVTEVPSSLVLLLSCISLAASRVKADAAGRLSSASPPSPPSRESLSFASSSASSLASSALLSSVSCSSSAARRECDSSSCFSSSLSSPSWRRTSLAS